MNPRTKYKMTKADLDTLMAACKPVPAMPIGGFSSPSPQENANRAWAELGKRMGFDSMTVEPDGSDVLWFTAVPSETDMNPNEQRIAIATACGYERLEVKTHNGSAIWKYNGYCYAISLCNNDHKAGVKFLPDFCNSLDAMAQAEATLNPKQAHEMDRILQRIVFKQSTTDENWATGKGSINTLIWHASARQRADAFCQVIKATPPAAES